MKRIFLMLTIAAAMAMVFSCASAPVTPEKPAETPPPAVVKPVETPPPAAVKPIEKAPPAPDRTGADAARKDADTARAKADAAKAGVAAKAEYDSAAGAYNTGKTELTASHFDKAAVAFNQAKDGFDVAAKLAAERKVAAEAAMKSADSSIQTTQDRLKAIEKEIGGSQGGTP